MNAKQLFLLLLCLVSSFASLSAQSERDSGLAGAAAALNRIIELNNRESLLTPEAVALRTGEALRWDVKSFGSFAPEPDTVLLLDSVTAVGRVQEYGQVDTTFVKDSYIYLVFDDGWKVQAIRSLMLTMRIGVMYHFLKSETKLTRKQQYELGNLELIRSSDSALRVWFDAHRTAMSNLADMVKSLPVDTFVFHDGTTKPHAAIKRLLKELRLYGVMRLNDGGIYITIGGVDDNTVGYIYSPIVPPPPINRHEFIWVEPIGDGWFLYRTT